MNERKVFLGFLGVVAAFILGFTLFGWGAPMTESNLNDVKVVTELLEKADTTDAKAVGLVFSPVEKMKDKNGNQINVQTVKYDMVLDTTTVNHFAILKVHKGFMKYKLDGIYELVK